jgi:hypothetical protein
MIAVIVIDKFVRSPSEVSEFRIRDRSKQPEGLIVRTLKAKQFFSEPSSLLRSVLKPRNLTEALYQGLSNPAPRLLGRFAARY